MSLFYIWVVSPSDTADDQVFFSHKNDFALWYRGLGGGHLSYCNPSYVETVTFLRIDNIMMRNPIFIWPTFTTDEANRLYSAMSI